MNPTKVKSVLDTYATILLGIGARPIRNKEPEALLDVYLAKHHLLWMCVEAKNLVDSGRLDKSMRWLGFLQGAFWALRLRTLEQMKSDNMPEDMIFEKERI